MRAETWLTAKDALAAGFVDEISGEADMSACVKFLPTMINAKFRNIPDDISNKKEKLDARDLERILRDGGCSNTLAKSIISNGFKAEQCDAAAPAEQRDVAAIIPKKKDRISDLLTRAEIMAPSTT